MERFEGRVGVVTGGASGIGFAICQRFAAEGMKVVVADVEEAALEKAVHSLTDAGYDALGVRCDVRDQASVDALRNASLSRFGVGHVVCNDAGVGAGGSGLSFDILKEQMLAAGLPFEETPLEEVADTVFRGIRDRKFWMLPASERADEQIRTRAQSMLDRENPQYMIEKRPPAAGGIKD